MNDAVGDQDIWADDLGRIDVDRAIDDTDVELATTKGLESGVCGNVRAVDDASVHNVVLEDVGSLLLGQVGSSRSDGSKGRVGWGKDGDILELINSINKAGCVQSTVERGEVGSKRSVGWGLWDGENLINDVDNTTSEV